MSRITLDLPEPGEARSSGPINTAFSAIATASTALTNDNFAREGLEWRNLANATPIERVLHQYDATATTFTNTSPALLVLGATTFSGAVTVASGERLLIRGVVHFETDYAGPTYGIPASRYVGADLTTDNGSTTVGDARTRRGMGTLGGLNGILRTFHVITTPGSYTVGLMTNINGGAGTYRVGRAALAVTRYKVQ